MTRNFMSAATILAFAAAAFAMTEIDRDGDNVITIQELQAAYPDVTEATFVSFDLDADGLLNESEFADIKAAGVIPAEEEEG